MALGAARDWCRVGAVAIGLVAFAGGGGAGAGAQAPRSLADGVYTATQAARGRTLYLVNCGSCHAENLNGGRFFRDEPVPALRRENLFDGWPELNAFFEQLQTAMPADDPMALPPGEYADILAYLLSANGYPAGPEALIADRSALARILVVRPAR